MGKYMRKSKAAAAAAVDAVMDINTTKSQSSLSLGVRTRAKTLALSKLQHSYLQLRSRKLQRQSIQNPNPNSKTRVSSSSRLLGVSSKLKEGEDEDDNQQIGNRQGRGNFEACIGENFAGRERSTRESTPCSFMKDLDTVGTPGSNTSASSPTEASRTQNSPPKLEPRASEVEKFFAGAEQQQHKQFIEKYNFDPVNEKPLPGRYGWVKTKDA